MDHVDLETLRFPIGRCDWHGPVTRDEWLRAIEETPAALRKAVAGLTDQQLDTRYRPEGWTIRQVVHHYADDHMNSYVRFKLALTEENPTIKICSEAAWAELPDARLGPIEPSLALLTALHQRWMEGWRALTEADWHRTFFHPKRGPVTLEQFAMLYSWHARHHVAQVRALRLSKGWTK